MSYYVGITIGPIVKTLMLASRPASLWCASAMYSWLSEDICNRALRMGGNIISPYYPDKKSANQYSVVSEGVGKYHDRIIFNLDAENIEALKKSITNLINDSKNALANELASDRLAKVADEPQKTLKEVICKYLQIHYIIEEKPIAGSKNCILRFSPYLDAAELCPSFTMDQSIQSIAALFEGKDDAHHNDLVKLCFGINNGNTSVLDQSGKVKDIESIANSAPASDRKIFNYYAIVQADGDSMGKLLSRLDTDEKVKEFSEKCLQYITNAEAKIAEFGGMTIYAGGDDLLFISPLENQNGTNIFELCSEIRNKFTDTFNNSGVTLSFGISINYKKFPLYEAFKDALNMLQSAKSVETEDKEKDKMAVHIRKSSGQSAKYRFTNQGAIYDSLQTLLKYQIDYKDQIDSIVLNSMVYKILLYRPLLIVALSASQDMEEAFKNIFDSEYHGTVRKFINDVQGSLTKIYKAVKKARAKDYSLEKIFAKQSDSYEEIAIDLLCGLLRTVRFFSEKRGQENV